jgi:hypothetical protein
MPKTVTKKARVETAYGRQLDSPIDFSYVYEELIDGDSIPAAEVLEPKDMRSFVNAKRNASARSTAQNKALSDAGIEKPTLEDPAVRLAGMVKIFIANGENPTTAEQMARQALGM